MTQQDKEKIHALLVSQLNAQAVEVDRIEPRLAQYLQGLRDEPEAHNAFELLGAIKFLRLLRTYEQDVETFRDVIYKYEGIWQQRDGIWQHVDGGLRHPGTTGPTYYRLQPFQVFVLASMFLFSAWINTENEVGSRGLLKTERADPDGNIYDLRRMCTEFTFFTPRKTAKTQLSAFVQFWYFMSGDENAECYCCANSSDQAKILFSRTRELIHQMDPKERRIRFTASQVNWKPGQFRTASLTALSAGGKTKDGLFAQLCSADEYGSAAYVNGASDMGKLVSVVESSMGPRREPMTFISTTAGIITSGPFIDKLQGMKQLLEQEADPDAQHDLSTDRQACLMLMPDEWEQGDEEVLMTDRNVRRKVNPMLGIIVQHSFYDDEIAKGRQNPEKKNEVLSKLFNVYRSMRVTTWLTGDQIRPRQVERRITDCKYSDGWNIFVGLDFGGNDDLFAITYLGINYRFDQPVTQRYFADCEVWIVEKALLESPNRPLYELWVEQGWLKVCPGEVFNPDFAINDLMAKNQQGLNLYMFGYDPAQSIQPINTIKAWLQSLGLTPEAIKKMVVPVPQSFVAMNGLIQKIEWLLLGQEYNAETGGWSFTNDTPFLYLSNSPLWPWGFQNAKVEISSSELRAIRKTTHHTKIDMIHALLDACYVFDLSEGQVQQ